MDDDSDYPSGPWIGFYLYEANSIRHRQELTLNFKQGNLSGDGLDGVGAFIIRGKYARETREVWWTKNYLGGHAVFYRGFREGKGIWGTWEINSFARGGFKIWPKALGAGEDETEAAEADAPVELVGQNVESKG